MLLSPLPIQASRPGCSQGGGGHCQKANANGGAAAQHHHNQSSPNGNRMEPPTASPELWEQWGFTGNWEFDQ